ncbi:alkylphosphonate utilization protein [bacterium]|nr:alkylphosphonate utilization protein [bacterium]
MSQCLKCQSRNTYQEGNLWICPECGHEWSAIERRGFKRTLDSKKNAGSKEDSDDEMIDEEGDADGITDAFGTPLKDGDSVTVIKELKIKGASSAVKVGTKVKNIRLVDGDDGHDISCKIDGVGSIYLKSEFVKKA